MIAQIIFISICLSAFGGKMVFSLSDEVKDKIARVPFVTVDKGYMSGTVERQFVVVKNEEEWGNLWARHKSKVFPAPQPPVVDFQREMIIAVFSGEKRTGGYGIEIRKIEEDREKRQLIVSFLEIQPPPRSAVIQVFTQPYHLVRLQKLDLPVKFDGLVESPQ